MPLILPDQYKIYRLIGIDPGINNTGISVFNIDYMTNKILNIEAFTIVNDKLFDKTGLDSEYYTERTIKLYKLKAAIQHILMIFNPAIVACESPFYNRFRPTAFSSLLEVLNMIHSSIIEYNVNIPFHTVEPLYVKKIVGAGMMKGKADVKLAIKNINEILLATVNNIDELDEHSVDAIAVGYAFLNKRF